MLARMRDDADEFRPLLAGTVRWEDDAAVVELGLREARVAGDAARLRAILGACDGRSTLGQLTARLGPDARELVTLLAAEGAIVDAEQAWRVLHRQSSVGSALGRPIDDQELAALGRATFAPAAPSHGTVALALAPALSAVGAIAARRRSTSPGDEPVPATFPLVSAVLAAAYTVTAGSETAPNRGTVASAGALYPLVVHLLVREPLGPAGPGSGGVTHAPRVCSASARCLMIRPRCSSPSRGCWACSSAVSPLCSCRPTPPARAASTAHGGTAMP